MKVEIDQSNRVEETEKDTILALSNNIEYSICIPSNVKKQVLRTLRRTKQSDKIIWLLIFSTGLYLLLNPYFEEISMIFIDQEYPGREGDIKSILLRIYEKKNHKKCKLQINFVNIGKHSRAHLVAYDVGRGRKPNKIVKVKELLSLLQ